MNSGGPLKIVFVIAPKNQANARYSRGDIQSTSRGNAYAAVLYTASRVERSSAAAEGPPNEQFGWVLRLAFRGIGLPDPTDAPKFGGSALSDFPYRISRLP